MCWNIYCEKGSDIRSFHGSVDKNVSLLGYEAVRIGT